MYSRQNIRGEEFCRHIRDSYRMNGILVDWPSYTYISGNKVLLLQVAFGKYQINHYNNKNKCKKHFIVSIRFKTNQKKRHPSQMSGRWGQSTSPLWQAECSSPLQGKEKKIHSLTSGEVNIYTFGIILVMTHQKTLHLF